MVLNGKAIISNLSDGICFSLGELDHLPEGAFYMVGGIEDVSARAEKLASER